METIIIGIDISKQHLGVFDTHLQKHLRFFNTREGIKNLIQHYAAFDNKKAIIESSGIHHRLVHQLLEEEGFFVNIVSHYKLKCFVQSYGGFSAADKVDAKMLCSYGQHIDSPHTPSGGDAEEELKNLLACKKGIQEEIARITQRQESGEDTYPFLKAHMENQLHDLRFHLKQIDQRLGH